MAVFTKYWPNGDALTLTTGAGGISVASDQNLTGSDREMVIQLRTTNQGEKATGSFTVKQAKGILPSYIITTNDTRIDFGLNNTPLSNLSTTGNATSSITVNGQSIVKNTIKEIYFGESYNEVTSIWDWFLRDCSSLTSVDLSGLSNITSIGDYFLYGCSSLTELDLSGLSSVASIGNRFLRDCSSLTSVDLSPLSNVTSIGDYFLYGCSSLTELDLSGLSSVTSIRNYFLAYCSGLTSIDLSPLSNVTSIAGNFLRNCSGLATLIMGAETPPTLGSNAFGNSNNLSLILVPCGSESAYKSATNWIAKASIIQGDC